jgi:eukaryotic-like serine/threonine-protein kinase
VLLTVSRGPQRVAVPEVVGKTRAEAVELLRRAGLVPAVFSVPEALPPGTVVAQRPRGGERAPKGSRVRINVSMGEQEAPGGTTTTTPAASKIEIPDIVGSTQAAAQRRLRAAGFVVRTTYVTSSQAQGTVVSQKPEAGTSAARGSTVRIGVSLGTSTTPARAVPDVTGEDEATATADLRNAGFTVEVVDQPTDDPNEDGVVLDEDPAPGTRAPAGSQVTIFVGRASG